MNQLNRLGTGVGQFYRTKDTVDMNDGKWGDETARLNTCGLMGCYGILVYTSHNGENRQGILTHYDPNNVLANGRKLKELIEQHPDMKTATKKKAVILHAIDDEIQMNYLEDLLKVKLSVDIEIQKEKVSMEWKEGEDFHGQVLYNVGQAEWFISGGGGKFE